MVEEKIKNLEKDQLGNNNIKKYKYEIKEEK